MIRILITSAGGSGTNNLIESLRNSSLREDIYVVGTHADKFELACSVADINYLVSYVRDEDDYIKELIGIVDKENIDLVIPNSDLEAAAISRHRNEIETKLFLPDAKSMEYVQDKYNLYNLFREKGIPVAETFDIEDLDTIEKKIGSLPNHGKFWIRIKTGCGSNAATWVKTAQQAKVWIKLWQELQGLDISQFTISEFLPGKDYAVHTIWNNGELLNAKIAERVTYFYGQMRLSGMASTPGIARTVDNRQAVQTCIDGIRAVSDHFQSVPNGVYELDMKENAQGMACITEINIGRFPMISPIFDRTGKQNSAELYVRCAMGLDYEKLDDPIDIEPGILMIRGLDKQCKIIDEHKVNSFEIGEFKERLFLV